MHTTFPECQAFTPDEIRARFHQRLCSWRRRSTFGKTTHELQKKKTETSIHWQNVQLYIFSFAFGFVSLYMGDDAKISPSNVFRGFNSFAYATVASLATCSLLVSFIMKHLDNVIKCFCAALSMLCVALIDSAMKNEAVPMRILLVIVLMVIALEQYNVS